MESGSATGLADGDDGLPLIHVLQTFWGLVAVLLLAGYSLLHTVNPEPAAEAAAVKAGPPQPAMHKAQPVVIGNVTMYPSSAVEPSLVVHLACDQEDARLARTYDPPPSGRPHILRVDQSLEQMRSLYRGIDPQFPKDTRLVTTPCMQALIDNGEFP